MLVSELPIGGTLSAVRPSPETRAHLVRAAECATSPSPVSGSCLETLEGAAGADPPVDEPLDVFVEFVGARDVPRMVFGDAHGAAFPTGVFEFEGIAIRLLDEVTVRLEFAEKLQVRRPASPVDVQLVAKEAVARE